MSSLPIRLLIFLLLAMTAAGDSYTGSAACAGCHRAIYDSYLKTAMGRSLTVPDPNLAGMETQIKVDALQRNFTVSQRGTQLVQSEIGEQNGKRSFEIEYPLAFAIGSGENGISFAIRRGDYLFQAPLSYYSASRKWDLSPGFAATGEGFNRPIFEACATCHAGRVQAVERGEGKYRDPPFAELAIGCENCHGPGQAHVAQPSRKTIVNPKRLPTRLAEDICMQCHQAGETRVLLPGKTFAHFRPGQPLLQTVAIFERTAFQKDADLLEHHSSMKASRCFRASEGRLSCLTCHNPHRQPKGASEVALQFNAKCLTCHTASDCPASPSERAKTQPADNCIACHMPKRPVSGITHSALTNHRIPRSLFGPAGQVPVSHDFPGLPGLVLLDSLSAGETNLPLVTRLAAYGELMDRDPTLESQYHWLLDEAQRLDPADPLVLAALGRKALQAGNFSDAIQLLSAAETTGSASSVTYIDLAEALGRAGQSGKSEVILEKARAAFPFSQPIRKRLILRYIQANKFAEARVGLAAYVQDFPDDDFMRGLLQQAPRP